MMKTLKKLLSSILPVILILCLSVSINKVSNANDYLKSWIPATCCVTNDCCWEISSEEIIEKQDTVIIKSTGQERPKQYSPDGKYYRCACDYDPTSQTWIKHQGANTRCVFVPQPSS